MKPPADLSGASQTLWRAIVGRKVISPSRAELLAQALRCRDRLEQVRDELASAKLTTTTPRTGATHVNPLLKVETELRRQFATIWGQLQLQYRSDIDGSMASILGRDHSRDDDETVEGDDDDDEL